MHFFLLDYPTRLRKLTGSQVARETDMNEAEKTDAGPRKSGTGTRRIAVVAVHGVGDHPQFATAREIGDLLSNLEYKPTTTPRYAPFTEVIKRINVRPVKVPHDGNGFDWTDARLQQNTWGPMDAIAQAAFLATPSEHPVQPADDTARALDHLFMKGQLIEYKGEAPEDTYQCLRLEGRRVAPVAPKDGAPPIAPDRDKAGEIASELRASGVELPSAPTPSAAGDAAPRPPADPASPGTQEKIVHIYEMYWSDLSQLGNAYTRIFGELYQLLFHLGSVSVNNVLAAAIHFQRRADVEPGVGKKWRAFSNAQQFAAGLLAWPIPILNLFMAALIPAILLVSMMRTNLSSKGEFIALDILATVLCVVGSGISLAKLSRVPAFLYPLPPLLFSGLGIVIGVLASPWNRDFTEYVVSAILLALSFAGVGLIIRAYDRQRPGSKRAAVWVAAVLAAALLIIGVIARELPVGGSTGYPAIESCLNILEVAFGLLILSWVGFYLAYMWAHVAGWRATRAVHAKNPTDADHIKARRTRWTAQLVLALTSIIFITLTICGWTGVVKVGVSMLPGQDNAPRHKPCAMNLAAAESVKPADPTAPCQGPSCSPVRYQPVSAAVYRFIWLRALRGLHSARETAVQAEGYKNCPPLVSRWSDEMLQAAGIGFLPVYLAAFLIALIIALWAMFPAVLTEINPPGSEAPAELQRESSSLGSWLDSGFRFMRWGGEVLYWTMWLPPLLVLVFNFALIHWIYAKSNSRITDQVIAIVGTFVAGAAVGVLGFAGRLKNFAGGLRTLVRVMLDVDNWLREHPRNYNPTARICGRYVSVLRHISEWRDSDPDKSPYDAMVIIAHSQGTVITADFLRFLHSESEQAGSMDDYDPELKQFASMPKFFFTMGCPLRQLYGLRFPYLYGWAMNRIADDSPAPGPPPDIGGDEAPRPCSLGVERWINAYRSGDYVGRYLWRGGDDSYRWDPISTTYEQEWDPPTGKPERVSADKAGHRIECCIGPGAHTHYWDHTAGLIAEVLDRIINNA